MPRYAVQWLRSWRLLAAHSRGAAAGAGLTSTGVRRRTRPVVSLEGLIVTGYRKKKNLNAALDLKRDSVGAPSTISSRRTSRAFPELNLAESTSASPCVRSNVRRRRRQIPFAGPRPRFTRVRINAGKL